MMILGMAALNMNALNTERKLRDVTATLRDFARRARAEALVQQRGFQIAFRPDGFAVQGIVVPMRKSKYWDASLPTKNLSHASKTSRPTK